MRPRDALYGRGGGGEARTQPGGVPALSLLHGPEQVPGSEGWTCTRSVLFVTSPTGERQWPRLHPAPDPGSQGSGSQWGWDEQVGTGWLLGQLQKPAAGRCAISGGAAPARPRHPVQDKPQVWPSGRTTTSLSHCTPRRRRGPSSVITQSSFRMSALRPPCAPSVPDGGRSPGDAVLEPPQGAGLILCGKERSCHGGGSMRLETEKETERAGAQGVRGQDTDATRGPARGHSEQSPLLMAPQPTLSCTCHC